MKTTRKNHKIIFKGLVLVLAFALSVLCFPVNGLIALAKIEAGVNANYNFITLEVQDNENGTKVRTGKTYTLPKAYIGGNTQLVIGNDNVKETVVTNKAEDKVTITGTSVEVRYGSNTSSQTIDASVGSFVAAKQGNYYITYSYSYKKGESAAAEVKEYVNSYDFVVTSELSSASINFNNNGEDFIPSVIDLSLIDGDKNLYLPSVSAEENEAGKIIIKDEDGEVVEGEVGITNDLETAQTKGKKYVYVSALAPNGAKLTLGVDQNNSNRYFIKSEDLKKYTGKFTVRYEYYDDGEFITYATKETQVYPKADAGSEQTNHYENYEVELRVASFPTSANTRVETDLPVATAVTSSKTNPANEAVDVYYQIEVRYKQTSATKGYTSLKNLEGNPYADVLDSNGYLKDPKKFKPLEDGKYTFIYKVTDFHGKTDVADEGVFEMEVKDEQDPKAVVFDGSNFTLDSKGNKVYNYENVDYKLASRANPNSVIVYAIGIDDNYSQNGDADVKLSRFIQTSTDEKYEIKYYNNYNLIFNYAKTSRDAYNNLITYNYLIDKEVTKWNAEHSDDQINSDARMLKWLKETKKGYLIVVDDNNFADIYSIFGDKKGEEADETLIARRTEAFGQNFTSADEFHAWLQKQYETEEGRQKIADLGFAYLDAKETFGKSKDGGGMGTGLYYIHYIAEDKSGNRGDNSRRINIETFTDVDAPEITFSTTLASSYLPTDVITFTKPDASDNSIDRVLQTRTAYRFLDKEGKVIKFMNGETEVPESELIDLDELFADLKAKNIRVDDQNQINRYKDYNDKDTSGDNTKAFDGYKELIDEDSSTFKIDLKDAPENAYKLQIVAWTYDDSGNPNIYGTTTNILRIVDNAAPKFVSVKNVDNIKESYQYAEEVYLPTLEVKDDQVAHLNFDVVIKYLDDNQENPDSTGYKASKISNYDGSGYYTIDAGYFVAGSAGEYQASVIVTDYNNNAVIYFTNYTVKGVDSLPDKLGKELDAMFDENREKIIELDEYKGDFILPTPTIDYSIPQSITYDEFKNAKAEDFNANGIYEKIKYVVIGVDKDGRATDMGLTSTYAPGFAFDPKVADIGSPVEISFELTLQKFDKSAFKFVEGTNENGIKGGCFIEATETPEAATAHYYLEKENEIVYVKATNGNEQGNRYILRLKEDGSVVETLAEDYTSTTVGDKSFDVKLFEQLKCYNRKSSVYHITVQDTIGPKIKEYNYDSVLTAEELRAKINDSPEGQKGILIHGIEATDASGIDFSKSQISVTWTPVDTRNGTETGYKLYEGNKDKDNAFEDNYFNEFKTVMDGKIDIVYTVYDKNGKSSTWSHKIVIGDNEAPEVVFPTNWLKDSYEVGSTLEVKIDNETLKIIDENVDEEAIPEVKLTLAGEEIKATASSTDEKKFYVLEQTGTYTLTITVTDKIGNSKVETKTINVVARTSNTAMTYQTIGIILIVISVLVLAGVIIYFIVSKVKLDKELKK